MNHHLISDRQLKRMIFIEGFGASGISFPFFAASRQAAGLPAVFLYILWTFLLTGYLFWISGKAYKKHAFSPGQSPFFCFGKTISVLYILRFCLNLLILLWVFSRSVRQIYLPEISLAFILLPMIFLVWYSAASADLQKRARFMELLFPWILTFLLIMLAAILFRDHGSFLLPRENFRLSASINKSYLLLLCSSPLEFLFFLAPCVTNTLWRERDPLDSALLKRKSVFLALLQVIISNCILWYLTCTALGPSLTASTPWSVVKLLQMVHLPGGFLERIDMILIVYWILCMIGVISGYLFYAQEILSINFLASTGEKRLNLIKGIFSAALLISLFFLLCKTDNSSILEDYFLIYKKYVDFPLLIILPLFVLWRPKKKRRLRSLSAAGILCLCLCLLGGCRHAPDIEDKNYISSLYVSWDKDSFVYTLAWANLAEMEEQTEGIPCKTASLRADSLEALENTYEKRYSREPEWNHIETIFVDEALFSRSDLFIKFLREWDDSWQKSPNVLLAVTEHTAEELYQLKTLPSASVGQEVRRLSENYNSREEILETPIDYLKGLDEDKKYYTLYKINIINNTPYLKTIKRLLFP